VIHESWDERLFGTGDDPTNEEDVYSTFHICPSH